MENRIDVVLSPESKETIFQEIKNARTGMPFLIKLTEDDRSAIAKLDDKRKPFVEKSFEFATRNSELDPGSGLLANAPKDIELYSFLASVQNDLEQLLEMVTDTKQLAGSEAYEVARIIYMKAKMNVKLDIPGSQAIVDELGKLFKANGSSTTPEKK